jgi:hypothetical protein
VVLRQRGCPKCKGDVWLDLDEYGWHEECIMCGYLCSLDGINYIDGAEKIAVTRQYNPKLYSFPSLFETLKKTMRMKVVEARDYIVAELSAEALERRQLRLRMKGRGVIKYTFDIALKELKDAGVVIARQTTSKSRRKKLVLVS